MPALDDAKYADQECKDIQELGTMLGQLHASTVKGKRTGGVDLDMMADLAKQLISYTVDDGTLRDIVEIYLDLDDTE